MITTCWFWSSLSLVSDPTSNIVFFLKFLVYEFTSIIICSIIFVCLSTASFFDLYLPERVVANNLPKIQTKMNQTKVCYYLSDSRKGNKIAVFSEICEAARLMHSSKNPNGTLPYNVTASMFRHPYNAKYPRIPNGITGKMKRTQFATVLGDSSITQVKFSVFFFLLIWK